MRLTALLLQFAKAIRSLNHAGGAWKVPAVMALDLVSVVVALSAAFVIVHGSALPIADISENVKIYVLIAIFCHFSFRYFGLYHSLWRFASLPDYANIVRSVVMIGLVLVAMNLLPDRFTGHAKVLIATPALVIFVLVVLVLVSSTRVAARYLSDLGSRAVFEATHDVQDVLLAGGLDECDQFIKSIHDNARSPMRARGIITTTRGHVGRVVRGVPVVGTEAMLADALETTTKRFNPKRMPVLIILAGYSEHGDVAKLVQEANRIGLRVRKLRVSDSEDPLAGAQLLQELSPEDILLRHSNAIDMDRVRAHYAGRTVMVTGGGGSVGSSICERLVTLDVEHLVVLDNSEYLLTELVGKLSAAAPQIKVTGRICDVRERERIGDLIARYKPWAVLHAAALKHVPVLEEDWIEGFKTNYFGTKNLLASALDNSVKLFVFISTDKAVDPVSVLGITKYCGELAVARADRSTPSFRSLSVRFGNVLASNGSAVPRFIEQAMRGGPVTITDPNMVRYFMTIEEATDLVLGASVHAFADKKARYNRYILNIGQPLKIIDLARRVIAAYSPIGRRDDVELEIIGPRPGERFDEKLINRFETEHKLDIPGLSGLTGGEFEGHSGDEFLLKIEAAVKAGNKANIGKLIQNRPSNLARKSNGRSRPEERASAN